ncbi:TetR family transcriptional regulator [Streptomyces sp. NA02950]|uniref:TetR/AcrR family transcriptional regulator n=1 Tax=Streptomyces sp. NA02950 TaxID=2742137 RepID=UPI00159200E5|nr:TetR family transcriptional regulator [Streptomyces sp. NA02950]QKV95621.1 TetR family transcriptional regulator [Streptomyces sp. NA02950]
MPRRYDPGRRQRIIDAAITVVGERGIGGLSHRTVAAEADVPLGSTTYHFATLDDLLVAALRQVNADWLAELERWERGVDPDRPLAGELLRLIETLLDGERVRLALEYELYLTALRREAVRPMAAACLDEMAALLARRTGDLGTARAVAALLDGVILQVLLTGRPLERTEVRAALERLTG